MTLTVTNVWTSPVTISGLSIGGTSPGEFQLGSSTCITALQPNQSCTVQVSFAPTTLATDAAHLDIADDEPSTPINVKLSGDGTYVQVTPRTIDFGNGPGTRTATITNLGATDVTLSNILIGTAPHGLFFYITAKTCGQTLAAGTSCTVTISFNPGHSGTFFSRLLVQDNDPGSPQEAALKATNGKD